MDFMLVNKSCTINDSHESYNCDQVLANQVGLNRELSRTEVLNSEEVDRSQMSRQVAPVVQVLEEGALDQGVLVVDLPLSTERSGIDSDDKLMLNDHYHAMFLPIPKMRFCNLNMTTPSSSVPIVSSLMAGSSRSFKDVLSGSSNPGSKLSFVTSSFRGCPALLFDDSTVSKLAAPFALTLVGKFLLRRPNIDIIRNFFLNLKLSGSFHVGLLDPRHISIQLSNDLDYSWIFSRRSYYIQGCQMCLLKWTLDFDVRAESPIALVWISFPNLRLHFFNSQVLFGMESIFGRPLQTDQAIASISRPSVARKHPSEIWLGSELNGYFQKIEFENLPNFCSHCKMHGHCVDDCYRLHPNLRKGNEKSTPVLPAAPLDVQANPLGSELGMLLPETCQGSIPNSDKLNNSCNPPLVSPNSVFDDSRLFKGSDNLAKDTCNVNVDELMVITTDYNRNFSSPLFSSPDMDLLVPKIISGSKKVVVVVTAPKKLLADQGAALQDGVEQTGYASGLINGALDPVGFLDPGAKAVVLEEGELDQGILVVDMPISNEQSGMLHDNNLFVNDHYLTDAFTDNDENFKNCSFASEGLGITGTDIVKGVRHPKPIVWMKPPVNYFKLNVDVATIDSVMDCGGLIWDSNGYYILGFARPILNYDVIIGINQAIIYGLRLCSSLDMTNIVVEVCSIFADQAFTMNDNYMDTFPKVFYLRRDIKNLVNAMKCSFSVVNTNGNACASTLAKWGSTLVSLIHIPMVALPFLVKGLIELDKIGMPYVSFCLLWLLSILRSSCFFGVFWLVFVLLAGFSVVVSAVVLCLVAMVSVGVLVGWGPVTWLVGGFRAVGSSER
ncbi:hypothetical protein M5K25_004832 [Dendrobium thyrsiflorum]|uniref:DUF4283 domain-containing protein n=1 Tax=Dendrobium thyrsiflorum TaxID=117978 RepID=A0ABD0VG80_DENTH